MKIEEIIEQLTQWSNAYYEGHQEVSDIEYDTLEEKLKELDPNNSYFFKNRESSASIYGQKRRHLYSFIGSVPKIHKIAESKISTPYTISAKMDGSSMTVYFKDGKVLYALTRADGYEGFDITDKYNKIVEKYDIRIPEGFTGAIRGEVVMGNRAWEEYKSSHANAAMQRNTGTGIINRKECTDDLKYLDFVVYELLATNIVDQDLLFNNQYNELDALKALNIGYPIAPYVFVRGGLYSEEGLQNLRDKWAEVWPLDGVVFNHYNGYIKGSDVYVSESIKEAYKFESESAETEVIGVEWTLQKSGRLIPVAIMKPVELSGALVRRATANNAANVLDQGIDVGAVVEICRSNEVIPKILKTLSPAEVRLPKECPHCGKGLITEGVHLVCMNDDCPEVNRLQVYNFLKVCGESIKGAGDSIYSLIAKKSIEGTLDFLRAGDFKKFTENQRNLISVIKNNIFNHMTWDKLLASLSIDALGDKTIKKLTKEPLWVADYFQGQCKTPFPKGIGPAIQAELSLSKNIEKAVKLYNILQFRLISVQSIEPVKLEDTSNTRYFCVTGSLDGLTRSQFETLCKAKNWEMSSLKKAECLITNDTTTGTSKNIEAQRLGKKIYSQKEFIKLYIEGV